MCKFFSAVVTKNEIYFDSFEEAKKYALKIAK
jgi:hypothetical protein